MVNFVALQEEIKVWELANFGERSALEPFLGIVEELGELSESATSEELRDATADVAIFAIDFCNARNFNVQEILEATDGFIILNECNIRNICSCLGRLAHHVLKQIQGIRGSKEYHEDHIKQNVGKLFRLLDGFASNHGFDFYSNLNKVWDEVSKRNWTVNKTTGGEV